MKLCKDCKWNTSIYCKSPSNGVDVISGTPKTRLCSVNREDFTAIVKNPCGKIAMYFEDKESEVKSRGFICEFFSKLFKEKE